MCCLALSWASILEGSEGMRALAAVHEIVSSLPNPSPVELADASLAVGTAGLALLCAYLSRAGLDTDENAAQFLEGAVRAVSTEPMGPSLYGGFTGIAWTLEHLRE